MIIQGDSEHALVAVIHDACELLTAATPRTSLVNSKGSNGAAERAVQSVEGMARTLRLDLLGRTSIAVGSDLPITSWMVRHAAHLLSHFQAGTADGKTACARQFERPQESLNGSVERSDAPACEVEKQLVYGLWLERSQTSNAHLIGTRVGIVVARTIRRLPTSVREDSNLVVAMRGTPVAGRPADAAADDAPTVTRHAVERGEVIVVLCNLWRPHCKRAAAKTPVHFPIQFQTCLSRQSRGHNHHRPQWKAATIQVVRVLTVLVLVVMGGGTSGGTDNEVKRSSGGAC